MPSSTPSASTASTAPPMARRSRPVRQVVISGFGFSECSSAWITTTASTGRGSRCRAGSANSTASTIMPNAASPAQRLVAPAAALAELPEKPAPTGMPCSSAPPRLHRPSATNSRLASTVSPCDSARLRMLPQDSANRIITRPNASSAMRIQPACVSSGQCRCRSGGVMWPTSSTPMACRSSQRAALIASTMATMAAGTLRQGRNSHSVSPVASATIKLGTCH